MKKLIIILILIFSCSVAWGEYTCNICGDTYPDQGKVFSACAVNHPEGDCCHYEEKRIREGEPFDLIDPIEELQKELELLKARIKELEDNEVVDVISEIGTETVYHSEEGAVYYFSGGLGHNCGGRIDKYGISLYAVMCPQCDQDAINEIKGRYGE